MTSEVVSANQIATLASPHKRAALFDGVKGVTRKYQKKTDGVFPYVVAAAFENGSSELEQVVPA